MEIEPNIQIEFNYYVFVDFKVYFFKWILLDRYKVSLFERKVVLDD